MGKVLANKQSTLAIPDQAGKDHTEGGQHAHADHSGTAGRVHHGGAGSAVVFKTEGEDGATPQYLGLQIEQDQGDETAG